MIKTYSSVFLILFALLITGSSCNKDQNWVNATVINSGDITYEGCGYVLQLEDQALLKPTYMPGAYQHDSLKVRIHYHHTGILDTCQYGSIVYDMVKLDDIELRK